VEEARQGGREVDPPPGYHPFTKALHWVVFTAISAQFALGYLIDTSGQGRGRGRGRGGGSGRGRGRGRGGDYDLFGDDAVLTAHVLLGATILALATVRLLWRWRSTLPPWAPTLSKAERTLEHWLERVLYVLMFAIPITGLWVVSSDGDALPAHLATHVAFFGAFALHVGLVLRHSLFRRDRLVRRML
jgi:cytochrome b561